MTDAPERIWLSPCGAESWRNAWVEVEPNTPHSAGEVEYICVDAHRAALQAAYAEGLESAAESIKEPIAQIAYDGWFKEKWPVTSHGYQKVQEACDAAIRALPNKYEVK